MTPIELARAREAALDTLRRQAERWRQRAEANPEDQRAAHMAGVAQARFSGLLQYHEQHRVIRVEA